MVNGCPSCRPEKKIFALEWPGQVRRGNASWGLSTGVGASDPGAWRPGTDRVRCTVDAVAAPEDGFSIR
jgi:hypothetical protein